MELIAGRKRLAEKKIQRGIFQEDALFTITICNSDDATWSHIGKYTEGYKFTYSQEKIYYRMYMNDTKLYAKNE